MLTQRAIMDRVMKPNGGVRGVTLIELLVVIGIIGILMGLLFPAAAMIRKSGRIKATQTLINALDVSLKLYASDFDGYPAGPNASALAADTGILYPLLGKGFYDNGAKGTGKYFGPYGDFPAETIKEVSTTGPWIIKDYFGNAVYYLNCKTFMESGGQAKDCHNATTFDLLSTGPNGKVDPYTTPLAKDYDDITNY